MGDAQHTDFRLIIGIARPRSGLNDVRLVQVYEHRPAVFLAKYYGCPEAIIGLGILTADVLSQRVTCRRPRLDRDGDRVHIAGYLRMIDGVPHHFLSVRFFKPRKRLLLLPGVTDCVGFGSDDDAPGLEAVQIDAEPIPLDVERQVGQLLSRIAREGRT